MALSTTETEVRYSGNNSTAAAYPIPFPFLEPSNIEVTLQAGSNAVPQVLGTSLYNVTRNSAGTGGSLLTANAVSSGQTVTIRRKTPLVQPTVFPLAGALSSKSLETALDRLTMQVQEERSGRTALAATVAETKEAVATIAENLQLPVAATPTAKGIRKIVYFATRPDGVAGTGTATDPFDASTAAKFDALMRQLHANGERVRVYLFPGLYQSDGERRGFWDGTGWWSWPGMEIVGIGDATLQLRRWPVDDNGNRWPYKVPLIGRNNTPGLQEDDILLENLTLDLNWPNLAGKPPGMQVLWSNGTNVSDGDWFEVGTTRYTFKTNLTPANGEVKIGVNATASILNASRAVNASGGTPGADYQVSAANAFATASASGLQMTVTAKAGYDGAETNSVPIAKNAASLKWGLADDSVSRPTHLGAPVSAAALNLLGKNIKVRNVQAINTYGHRDSLFECFSLMVACPGDAGMGNCEIVSSEVSRIHGDYGMGVVIFGSASSGHSIRDNYVTGSHNAYGISCGAGEIVNNRSFDCPIGVYLEQSGDPGNVVRNLRIAGNHFLRTRGSGMFMHNPYFTDTPIWREWLIENNVFELDDTAAPNAGGGVVIGGYTNTDNSRSLQNVTIRNNLVTCSQGWSAGNKSGIYCGNATGVTIEGNTVDSRLTLNDTLALGPDGYVSTNVQTSGNRYSDRSQIPGLSDAGAPYCLLYMSDGTTINHNSGAYVEAKLPFDTALVNRGQLFNATTDKVIVGPAGPYRVTTFINSNNYEGELTVTLAVNGRFPAAGADDFGLAWKVPGYQVPSSVDVWLPAGAELELYVGHSATSTNVQFFGGYTGGRSTWAVESKW